MAMTVVSKPASTIITIERPDGSIETVERAGTILDAAMRRKMELATAAAGKGQIIKWEITKQTTRTVTTARDLNPYQSNDATAPCSYCHGYCHGSCR